MTNPVQIGAAQLWLGDCREILPTLGKVDAVVTDPPYGINIRARVNFPERAKWDSERVDLGPVMAAAQHHVIWGGQYYADVLPMSESWLCWVKRPLEGIEKKQTHTTIELAWSDFGKPRFKRHVWDGGMREGHQDNRLFCHPSQKPVEIMRWCLGDLPAGARTICDPYMGSGTTGVAAADLGLTFTGIEANSEYFDIACKRIEDAYRQADLFIKQPKVA